MAFLTIAGQKKPKKLESSVGTVLNSLKGLSWLASPLVLGFNDISIAGFRSTVALAAAGRSM